MKGLHRERRCDVTGVMLEIAGMYPKTEQACHRVRWMCYVWKLLFKDKKVNKDELGKYFHIGYLNI